MNKYHLTLVMALWIILSGCFSEEASAYRQAVKTNNPRKVEHFIKAYPQGKYTEKAKDNLESIYYKACTSESACVRYLAKYKTGNYVGSVMDKLEKIRFEECKSIFACERYIKEYPDGKYINEAVILEAKEKLPELTRSLSADEIMDLKASVAAAPAEAVKKNEIAVIETKFGIMKMRFFADKAPNHCANFKRLANAGFYDGVTFHRLIPGFMIQGGDINSRDGNRSTDGMGGPGYNVDAEFNDIPHTEGIVSMARAMDPNSAGSQFFICDGNPSHLDGNYTVFGEIFEGLDIIGQIANLPRDRSDNPLNPVYMRVSIVEK